MNHKLLSFLIFAAALPLACESGTDAVKRDTADFFTKLSQGYRVQVVSQLPTEAMWTKLDSGNKLERWSDLGKVTWAKTVASLAGHIMQQKGVMEGRLVLLFKISHGEIQGDVKVLQPVVTIVPESESIHQLTRERGRALRTTHAGSRDQLGTAFRVLEKFAADEELELSGWGSVSVVRGAIDERNPADYLTEAKLYLK